MIFPKGRRILAALMLSLLLLVTACTATQTPGRFDQAQKESSQQRSGQAIAKTATQGGEFNKFFPKSSDGFQTVPAQEKKGFAEYKLKQDGKDVAMLSVSDTTSLPTAAAKFKTSTKKIAGYPAVEIGNQTAVLVSDRYQVKVLSRAPSFTASDRVAWLKKFNLKGLAMQ